MLKEQYNLWLSFQDISLYDLIKRNIWKNKDYILWRAHLTKLLSSPLGLNMEAFQHEEHSINMSLGNDDRKTIKEYKK